AAISTLAASSRRSASTPPTAWSASAWCTTTPTTRWNASSPRWRRSCRVATCPPVGGGSDQCPAQTPRRNEATVGACLQAIVPVCTPSERIAGRPAPTETHQDPAPKQSRCRSLPAGDCIGGHGTQKNCRQARPAVPGSSVVRRLPEQLHLPADDLVVAGADGHEDGVGDGLELTLA